MEMILDFTLEGPDLTPPSGGAGQYYGGGGGEPPNFGQKGPNSLILLWYFRGKHDIGGGGRPPPANLELRLWRDFSPKVILNPHASQQKLDGEDNWRY